MKQQVKKKSPALYAGSIAGSSPKVEQKQTQLESVISRFQTQNGNLESLLNNILGQVYRLYPEYESEVSKTDGVGKEPGSIVEQLNNLLDWQSGNLEKAREINNHLNTVV